MGVVEYADCATPRRRPELKGGVSTMPSLTGLSLLATGSNLHRQAGQNKRDASPLAKVVPASGGHHAKLSCRVARGRMFAIAIAFD